MSAAALTEAEHRTMLYIQKHVDARGYAPTLSELATCFTVSKPTMQARISSLCRKGYLDRLKYRARGIHVLRQVEGGGRGPGVCPTCGGVGYLQ